MWYTEALVGTWIPWFATAGTRERGVRSMTIADVLIATIVGTPFHISTLVTRRETWAACLGIYRDGNPYDIDRLLAVELCKHGHVAFNPHPHVYVRRHEGQETVRLSRNGQADLWWKTTSARLLEFARSEGLDVQAEIASRLQNSPEGLKLIVEQGHAGSIEFLRDNGLLRGEHLSALNGLTRRRWARRWVPGAWLNGYAKIRRALSL
jgi:hypothetical protein